LERIIAGIAFVLYKNKKTEFTVNDTNQAISDETDTYGSPNINTKQFLELLKASTIVEENDNCTFRFANREYFAFYVALHCVLCHAADPRDDKPMEYVFNADLSVAINFIIIMCISAIMKNQTIPAAFVDKISEECAKEEIVPEKDILGFAQSAKEIRHLQHLDKEDIKKIDKKKDEQERVQRNRYLKHHDDYYFDEQFTDEEKDLESWFNRIKVINVLLNHCSSRLNVKKKNALIDCAIKAPNIVITKFYKIIFSRLDQYAITYMGKGDATIDEEAIEQFQEFMIDVKRAFILTSYSVASRGFSDKATLELLKGKLKEQSGEMGKIQRLMLLSYSSQVEAFKSLTNECMSKSEKSAFVKTSAFLIARNYCYRNPEDVTKNHKDLLNMVVRHGGTSVRAKVYNKAAKSATKLPK